MPENSTESTRSYVERRARESNITEEKLWLDPEFDEDGILMSRDGDSRESTDHAHLISGIFDGALDIDLETAGLYEVNIADWIAELYNSEYDPDRHEGGWSVIVTEYNYGDPGEVVYRVNSNTYGG